MKKVKMAFINGTDYRVTSLGEIVNKYGRPLRGGKINGHQVCTLRVNNKSVNVSTAREVYNAFKGTITEGNHIYHIDGNKSNNNIKNLKCVTKKVGHNTKVVKIKMKGLKNRNEIKYERID